MIIFPIEAHTWTSIQLRSPYKEIQKHVKKKVYVFGKKELPIPRLSCSKNHRMRTEVCWLGWGGEAITIPIWLLLPTPLSVSKLMRPYVDRVGEPSKGQRPKHPGKRGILQAWRRVKPSLGKQKHTEFVNTDLSPKTCSVEFFNLKEKHINK